MQGDLTDRACLDTALRGVTSVLLVSPGIPAQELNVIAASASAGVDHVVKITSDASADSPIERRREHSRIESALAASGLTYSLLRSNAYMQNLLMLAPGIAATGGFGSVAGEGRIGMVDSRDVAAVAAHIVSAPAEPTGNTYWLSGPESISYAEAAAQLSAVLGRPINYTTISFNNQRAAMIAAGMPEALAQTNSQALELFSRGDSDWVTEDVARILGRPARTFGDFAAEHAPAFTP